MSGISDIPQWLLIRLGSSEKTWVDGSIAPYLTKELLKGIYDCFLDLQTHLKIKLLLSFLHMVRRNVDMLRPELESIIELAIKDPDQWVSLTAEFLKYFPSKGEFNLNIIENSGMFHGMRNDIKKHLKRLADRSSDLQFVPYEAEFMNKKAFTATFGNVPPPVKHFTLKQKPKSATLRADALAKATELAKPRNQTGSTLPVRSKDQSKGIDALIGSAGISAAAKRAYAAGPQARVQAAKEKQAAAAKLRGGVKLLDSKDLPVGEELRGTHKRRRKLVGVPVGGSAAADPKDERAEAEDIAEPVEPAQQERDATPTTEQVDDGGMSGTPPNREVTSPLRDETKQALPAVSSLSSRPLSPETPMYQSAPSWMTNVCNAMASPAGGGSSLSTPSTSTGSQPNSLIKPPEPTRSAASNAQVIHPSPGSLVDLKNIKLTKDQQRSITEIFASANRVTRTEKILIINFIVGQRENPCPHLGPILTVRLSENLARVTVPDGREVPAMVEEYFHMNFDTGEWKRLRKHKAVDLTAVREMPTPQIGPSGPLVHPNTVNLQPTGSAGTPALGTQAPRSQ